MQERLTPEKERGKVSKDEREKRRGGRELRRGKGSAGFLLSVYFPSHEATSPLVSNSQIIQPMEQG